MLNTKIFFNGRSTAWNNLILSINNLNNLEKSNLSHYMQPVWWNWAYYIVITHISTLIGTNRKKSRLRIGYANLQCICCCIQPTRFIIVSYNRDVTEKQAKTLSSDFQEKREEMQAKKATLIFTLCV